jgi:hypothetical protein
MVAVPEMPVSEPVVMVDTGRFAVPRSGRAVAIAVRAAELLRPGSDLVRLVSGFPEAEILVVADSGGRADPDDDDLDRAGEGLRAEVARLGLPDLRLHRLGMPDPLPSDADEDLDEDLVAALSELIGFDPEPGVYCLAPEPEPGDPARAAVNRAAERIAQVYGIPLLRYRCPELAVLGAQ